MGKQVGRAQAIEETNQGLSRGAEENKRRVAEALQKNPGNGNDQPITSRRVGRSRHVTPTQTPPHNCQPILVETPIPPMVTGPTGQFHFKDPLGKEKSFGT